MSKCDKPQPIDPITFAFPARVDHLMPAYSEIPDEFKSWRGNRWVDIQEKWFFRGLTEDDLARLKPKPGIDSTEALRHLGAIQRSFQPKHEHKSAAVAYLMSQWFELAEATEPAA